MAGLKPIEVVMRIDFASSNGIEVIAHAERVCELVRCKDCKFNSLKRLSGNVFCNYGIGLYQLNDFCSKGERKEAEDAEIH